MEEEEEEEEKEKEIEIGRKRCQSAIQRLEESLEMDMDRHNQMMKNKKEKKKKVRESCIRTLLKLFHSELAFLSRSCSSSSSHPNPNISLNIGHLEAILHLLEQPFITGVSRVCKPIPLPPPTTHAHTLHSSSSSSSSSSYNKHNTKNKASSRVHVDIVCTVHKRPTWILVSDRNPKCISWKGSHKCKGLKFRIQRLLAAAHSSPVLQPSSLVLFFSRGLDKLVRDNLHLEFGASDITPLFSSPYFHFDFYEEPDSDWINVFTTSYKDACVLHINIHPTSKDGPISSSEFGFKDSILVPPQEEQTIENTDKNSCSLKLGMQLWPGYVQKVDFPESRDLAAEDDLINFDTTALVALVSGISNGCSEKLLATPEIELRRRFKGNLEFVVAQAMSEIQNPILAELAVATSGKRGIICQSVLSEFKELVSLCGGPNEKIRADEILKHLMVVPDSPSERMLGLPTTRKLTLKNKVVFGSGDHWHAPTLTANMAFVRAVSQTGISLLTVEHRPRALTGD